MGEATRTRNRIGPRQVAILRDLAGHESLSTQDLAWSLDVREPGDSGYETALAAIRRALALLRRKGLVECRGRYLNTQGRPTSWTITDTGREFLAKRPAHKGEL